MIAAAESFSRPEEGGGDLCCACRKDLSKGQGRFVLEAGSVCVECYDAGRRCVPRAEPPRA